MVRPLETPELGQDNGIIAQDRRVVGVQLESPFRRCKSFIPLPASMRGGAEVAPEAAVARVFADQSLIEIQSRGETLQHEMRPRDLGSQKRKIGVNRLRLRKCRERLLVPPSILQCAP